MRTVLYDRHVALGAKMVDFAGWEMPLQYKDGIIHEHLVVREKVGLFDVSHMGIIFVTGRDAESFLDFLSTNRIADKADNTATYTVWAHPEGGSVDDLIIYRQDVNNYFVVVNASNRTKDHEFLKRYMGAYNVQIIPLYDKSGILSLQGPLATDVIAPLFPATKDLAHNQFFDTSYQDMRIYIANTGYTGAGGFEVFAPNEAILQLWDVLLEQGKSVGIEPIGLGARDTLRLEMGYALYGHELSDEIAPVESVSAWTVKLNKGNFLGKKALENLEKSPTKRHEYGIKLIEPGIARQGYDVILNDVMIGRVTSGTQSPSLQQAIAIILVDRELQIGDQVQVKIRDKLCKAEVVKLPFLEKRK